MSRFLIRRLVAVLTLAAVATLTACGGSSGDEDPGTNDVAATYVVTTQQAAPIAHTFTEAGTYTLTVTGDYAPAAGASDTLNVWFSFSGQGSIASGNAEPAILVSGASVHLKQSVSVTLTGAGPWDVQILTNTALASGTMTSLTLNTSKR